MNTTTIDFETYFDAQYSLRKLPIPLYVGDPRFRIHGLAIAWPDGTSEFRFDVSQAIEEMKRRVGADFAGTTIVCHNAHFDLYILSKCFGIHPRHFIDTLQLAHHVHGRRDGTTTDGASLAELAERYGLPDKGNIDFMSGVLEPNLQQRAELAAYAKRDVEITAKLAEKLLPGIDRPGFELKIAMHTARLFTERGVTVECDALVRVKDKIVQQTRAAIARAAVTPKLLSSNKQFAARLATALAQTGRLVPLKKGTNSYIPAIAKKDQEMQKLLQDDDPEVAALAAARLEKKSESQKIARLETLQKTAHTTGGILPPHLVYYGASTGRFAGGGGFNIQNLGRHGDGKQIREMLRPREGHVFIIGDYSQVEARITAWYAYENELLADFEKGLDVYSQFISPVFGREVRKPVKTDPPAVAAELTALREVGKAAVLGLGFQMGGLTFLNQLRGNPATAPLFKSGMLTPAGCYDIVQAFRQRYGGIRKLWSFCDESLRSAMTGEEISMCRLTFLRRGDGCRIILPSGRSVRYPKLRIERRECVRFYLDRNGEIAEFEPNPETMVYGADTHVYGGKLTENVVQATARDLLVELILRLEEKGLSVVFHVHDEVVIEVPRSRAEEARRELEAELRTTPEWAIGLPLSGEAKIVDRYSK